MAGIVREAAVAVIVVIAVLAAIIYCSRMRQKKCYTVIWKKSGAVAPEKVMCCYALPEYGYNEYYQERESDEKIKEMLAAGEHVLITGITLSGKSRSIYQALAALGRGYDVLIPRLADWPGVRVPWHFCFWRKKIVVFDDINEFLKKQNFICLFRELLRRKAIILASCRSGTDYDEFYEKINRDLAVFAGHVHIPDISWETAERLAAMTRREVPHGFDGSVGAIFLRVHETGALCKSCGEQEKNILASLRCLYLAGVYKKREIFSTDRVKQVCCKKYEVDCTAYDWDKYLSSLQKKGFLRVLKNRQLWAVKTYLEHSVGDAAANLDGPVARDQFLIDNFYDLMDIFNEDFIALFSLGKQAYYRGMSSQREVQYMMIAVAAFEQALRLEAAGAEDYAALQFNLASAYSSIAGKDEDEEEKAEACRQAVKAYEEALSVKINCLCLFDFARINYELGNCYSILAVRDNKSHNSKKAVQAYRAALKVYTAKRFPEEFARTQNKLGLAFSLWAEVEDKAGNCDRAIESFKKALEMQAAQPETERASAQNNLGAAYTMLAESRDRRDNCLRAIQAHEQAFKVFVKDEYPMEYACTLAAIGRAYYTLSWAENKTENCLKAVKAYEEAIEYRTAALFPVQYASILNNIGEACCALAEAEENGEKQIKYLKKAIGVYCDSLNYRTFRNYPVEYAVTQNNTGSAYRLLAALEQRKENSLLAIAAHEEALKVFSPGNLPIQYAGTLVKLGKAHVSLAVEADKARHCTRAINYCLEALDYYDRQMYSVEYALTCFTMGDAYLLLSGAEDEEENLKRSVQAYEQAFKKSKRLDLPLDYGDALHKLADTFSKLAELANKEDNLKKTCQVYEEALKYFPIESSAGQFAAIQIKLGHNYNLLAELADREQNSRNAVKAFREALRVYKRDIYPVQYASTCNKLGNAYTVLGRLENSAANYNNAAVSYRNAMTVFTKEAFPEVYQVVERNLYRVLHMADNS
jgi:tetratricopeptide (TPR) repeat protein